MSGKNQQDGSLTSSAPEARSSLRKALPQILAVCVKNVLLLDFGMTIGFATILIPSLSKHDPDEPISSLSQEHISWIGSLGYMCVPIGGVLSGIITQPIGRKRSMQWSNVAILASWLLYHFSTEVWQIYLALAITGLIGGLLEAPVLTYVAEITKPSLRGILGSTSTVAVIGGIIFQFLLGTFLHWRKVALINSFVPVISFFLYFLIPESPHWLIVRGQFLSARKSLAWLRGWVDVKDVEVEFQQLFEQINKSIQEKDDSEESVKCWDLYKKKDFWWPYGLVEFAFFLGHFSGMTSLQTYSVAIFEAVKSPVDKYYATISLGVAEILGCILSVFLIHYVGKRALNLFSLVGCGVCFMVAATFAYQENIHYLGATSGNSTSEEVFWTPTISLVSSAFFTHAGIRILPWMLIGEVFANEIRSTASGLCGATSYVFASIVNKTFLQMVAGVTLPGTFWFYSAVCLIGALILYFILPETEGKNLYDIIEHFRGNGKLDNKVYRNKEKMKRRKNNNIKKNGQINEGYVAESIPSANNDSFYRSMAVESTYF